MPQTMWSKDQAVCAMTWQKQAIRAERSYRTEEEQARSSSLLGKPRKRPCVFAFEGAGRNNLPFGPFQEILRPQWSFSPHGSTSEVEHYQVDLDGVAVLELALKPDLTPGNTFATLGQVARG